MKKCSKCGELKEEVEFYKDKRTKDGLYSCCKTCQLIMINRYNDGVKDRPSTKEYRDYHRKYIKEYREEKEERKKSLCRMETYRLIKSGKIKTENCSVCNSKDSQSHHTDYESPYHIIWLCIKHHAELHTELRKARKRLSK